LAADQAEPEEIQIEGGGGAKLPSVVEHRKVPFDATFFDFRKAAYDPAVSNIARGENASSQNILGAWQPAAPVFNALGEASTSAKEERSKRFGKLSKKINSLGRRYRSGGSKEMPIDDQYQILDPSGSPSQGSILPYSSGAPVRSGGGTGGSSSGVSYYDDDTADWVLN
jgi:hypothetical protein